MLPLLTLGAGCAPVGLDDYLGGALYVDATTDSVGVSVCWERWLTEPGPVVGLEGWADGEPMAVWDAGDVPPLRERIVMWNGGVWCPGPHLVRIDRAAPIPGREVALTDGHTRWILTAPSDGELRPSPPPTVTPGGQVDVPITPADARLRPDSHASRCDATSAST